MCDHFFVFVYERIGRKYPCRNLPRICLLLELPQILFHHISFDLMTIRWPEVEQMVNVLV